MNYKIKGIKLIPGKTEETKKFLELYNDIEITIAGKEEQLAIQNIITDLVATPGDIILFTDDNKRTVIGIAREEELKECKVEGINIMGTLELDTSDAVEGLTKFETDLKDAFEMWEKQGENFGKNLLAGLETQKPMIQDAVKQITEQLEQVQSAEKELQKLAEVHTMHSFKTTKSDKMKMKIIDELFCLLREPKLDEDIKDWAMQLISDLNE